MATCMDVTVTNNGHPPKVWVATVNYEFVDGWHLFTSGDISGLTIASEDPSKAFQQIVPTIQALIKHNHGLDCNVQLGQEFRVFEKRHSAHSPLKGARVSLRDTLVVIQETSAAEELEAA